MPELKPYTPEDKLKDLIDDNSLMLPVIGRFGISLGFRDSSIIDVCKAHDADCPTFLAVANFINDRPYDGEHISLLALIGYLKNAHSYFIDFFLPKIKFKLMEAIGTKADNEISLLILKFFDDYVDEVRRHMRYENSTVFAYAEGLVAGELRPDFSIARFSAGHNHMASKLKELKDIIIRHYPQRNSHLLNSVLFDLLACEQDLKSHCRIEDRLFVPCVERLEEALRLDLASAPAADVTQTKDDDGRMDSLSNREKEVIKCVAKGMSNKEIADVLCLSVHTVTTYRRNLSAKLEIHSPAGLTIFAIINKLVDLDDIKIQ